MSEIDFAGEARKLHEDVEPSSEGFSHINCGACFRNESALRSIAQRVQEELVVGGECAYHEMVLMNVVKRESEIRADERAKVLDAVIGTLTCFPILGGHKPIMEQVDRIVTEARADERRKWAERIEAEMRTVEQEANALHAESDGMNVPDIARLDGEADSLREWAKRLRENSDR